MDFVRKSADLSSIQTQVQSSESQLDPKNDSETTFQDAQDPYAFDDDDDDIVQVNVAFWIDWLVWTIENN